MNCPEQEQLMLYLDNELSSSEIAEIKAHVATCPRCQKELANFKSNLETEAVLRKKVNMNLARRNLSQKIMVAVMVEPKHSKQLSSSYNNSLWASWLLKFLVPAMALAVVLFFLLKPNSPSPVIFDGKAYRLSVFTNNADSFVDGRAAEVNHSFSMEANKFQKLDGSFLVNVVSVGNQFSLLVEGKTEISFDKDGMMPVFKDCLAKISIINGASAKISVNGKTESLTRDNPIDLLPFGKGGDVNQTQKSEAKPPITTVDSVETAKTEKIKAVDSGSTSLASSTQANETKDTTETLSKVTDVAEHNTSEIPVIPQEEGLTTSSTGAISIIDTARESNLDEWRSPFAETQIGGN